MIKEVTKQLIFKYIKRVTEKKRMEKILQINSKIENLRKVEKLVDDLSAEYSISADVYGNILIAALEAANNAILHGNKLNDKKNCKYTCKHYRKEIEN